MFRIVNEIKISLPTNDLLAEKVPAKQIIVGTEAEAYDELLNELGARLNHKFSREDINPVENRQPADKGRDQLLFKATFFGFKTRVTFYDGEVEEIFCYMPHQNFAIIIDVADRWIGTTQSGIIETLADQFNTLMFLFLNPYHGKPNMTHEQQIDVLGNLVNTLQNQLGITPTATAKTVKDDSFAPRFARIPAELAAD